MRDTSRPWYSEMGDKVAEKKESVEAIVRTIRRVTREKYSKEIQSTTGRDQTENAGGAPPAAHADVADGGMIVEVREVHLNLPPRFVPLLPTRYMG